MLCQFTPSSTGGEHETLAAYVDVPDVYPVGRLDADSEGLVLLTDDAALQHRLSDPRFKQPKTYLVQVEGVASAEAAQRLVQGIAIQGRTARAVSARVLGEEPALPPRRRPIRERRNIPTSWMEIVLDEGRNRQVRRMTAAVGLPTLRLVRVAIGALRLGDLEPGAWRHLSDAGVRALRASVGLR